MKKGLILFLLAVVAICSCGVTPKYGTYAYMQVERDGGGNMHFNYAPSSQANTYDIHVTKYDFSDVDVRFQLASDGSNASIFRIIDSALNGQAQINGPVHSTDPSLLSGTWLHAYMVNANATDEITNADLVESIAQVETFVRAKYLQ